MQPNRKQVEPRASDLESLLGADHRAHGNRPALLFALWLYGVLNGLGSGREVTRLSREHDAYRWSCGGVSVDYHALNDFRSGNEAPIGQVLTAKVAALAVVGAISLKRVARGDMRVRADAGTASFRRQASLVQFLAETGGTGQGHHTTRPCRPGSGQRPAHGPRGGLSVRAGTQADAHDEDRAAVARSGHR